MKFWISCLFLFTLFTFSPLGWSQENETADTRIQKLEEENAVLKDMVNQLKDRLDKIEKDGVPSQGEAKDSKKKKGTEDAATEPSKEQPAEGDAATAEDKKKDEFWLPSIRGEKFSVGGRVQVNYFNTENEKLLQSAIPNNPGGGFSLDEVRLYVDAELNKDMKFFGVFDMMEDTGNVVESYIDLENIVYLDEIRVGLQPTFYRPSRYTETYPLVGRAFWKSRQLGATIQKDFLPFSAYFSVLNGSKLENTGIGEDKSSDIIGMEENNLDIHGNKEISAGLGFDWDFGTYGRVNLLGFAGTGELDSEDVVFLQTMVPGYGFAPDKTKDFAGGTATYKIGEWDFLSQYIAGQDGELDRSGWYSELSYKFNFENLQYLRSLRPLVRYGELDVDLSPQPYVRTGSLTWDREQWLLALIFEIRKNLFFQAEYAFNEEETGGPGANNNEFLFQIEYAF
ncbi:MAG: hypothetical protein RBU29_00500 [bacterium]|jgi:hypothetical protein|nr:hypothetical protein [bacterium]